MAQKLNTLVVKVMGDIKDVQGKLGKLQKSVKASNKKIDKFSKGIQKGFQNFLKYTAIIGTTVMALRKLTKFFTSSLQAYNDQELALAKLTSALKSTGRFSLETMDDMERFASTMQDTTGISDDLVNSAQAIMTTFTQISTKTFPEAITLAADMSKMFGQDLQQSVIQLGTALNDPIRGVGRLRRIGISFSEEQKKQIEQFMEQNDLMSAQRVILDELQMEIGGTAVAMGQTFAGQADIMKASIVDLKEQIGELMGDAMKPMLPVITKAAKAWTGYLDVINEARKAKEAFQKVWAGDLELSKLETEKLQQANSARELQIQVDALAWMKRSRDTSKAIREKEALIKSIQDEMKARAENIKGLETKARLILEAVEAVEEEKEVIEEATESLMELNFELDSFNQNMIYANNIMAGNFAPNLNDVRYALDESDIAMQNMNLDIAEGTEKWAKYVELNENRVIPSIVDLKKKTEAAGEAAKLTADDFLNAFNTAFSSITAITDQFYKNKLMSIDNDITAENDRLSNLKDNYDEDAQSLQNKLDAGLISQETYDNNILALDNELTIAQGDAMDELEKKRKKIIHDQAKADKATAIVSAIINTAQGVTKAWGQSGILGIITSAIVAAAGAAQVALIAAQPLPALAMGGIAVRDTLAQIGEGGRKEAVIPLTPEGLNPFAQAMIDQLGKIRDTKPVFNGGNTLVQVQIGSDPLIMAVQKALDNKQLRVNAKTIR